MADNLVIVESPAKARTIKKYLGRGFNVLASYGHVRDLVPKEGAVACAWHYEAPQPDAALPDALLAVLAEFRIDRASFAGFTSHVDAFARQSGEQAAGA